jgi:hypothetical protein
MNFSFIQLPEWLPGTYSPVVHNRSSGKAKHCFDKLDFMRTLQRRHRTST